MNLASELQPLEGPGKVPAQPLPGVREVEHSCHFQGAFCSLVVRAQVPVLRGLAGLCRVSAACCWRCRGDAQLCGIVDSICSLCVTCQLSGWQRPEPAEGTWYCRDEGVISMKSLVAGYRASDRLPQECSEPAPLAVKHTGIQERVFGRPGTWRQRLTLEDCQQQEAWQRLEVGASPGGQHTTRGRSRGRPCKAGLDAWVSRWEGCVPRPVRIS